MNTKEVMAMSAVFIMALGLSAISAQAFEVETHEGINEKIARGFNGFSLNDYLVNELRIGDGVDEYLNGRSVATWMRDGGRYEDKPGFGANYLRSVNHFHNPLTDKGFSGFLGGMIFSGQSAKDWAQSPIGTQQPDGCYSWYDVREYFYKGLTWWDKTNRERFLAETFRGIGQLMHLVQDMSVPAHTRDDPHVVGYEPWVRDNIDVSQTVAYFFDKSILARPTSGLPISNIFDTNQYNGSNPDITMAFDIGLSEYTNANFFSEDTISSSKFAYPKVTNNTPIFIKHYEGPSGAYDRQYFLKDGLGETNGGEGYLLSAVDYYDWWRVNNPVPIIDLPVVPVLDENVYADYSKLLIRRAMAYSAGLLGYFFRGQLDFEPTDVKPNGDIEIGIGNLSDEVLAKGKVELYYDNMATERKQISLSDSVVENLAKGDRKKVTFSPPSDFELGKENQYVLVYDGQMGNEDRAVIGKFKVLSIPSMVIPIQKVVSAGNVTVETFPAGPIYDCWLVRNGRGTESTSIEKRSLRDQTLEGTFHYCFSKDSSFDSSGAKAFALPNLKITFGPAGHNIWINGYYLGTSPVTWTYRTHYNITGVPETWKIGRRMPSSDAKIGIEDNTKDRSYSYVFTPVQVSSFWSEAEFEDVAVAACSCIGCWVITCPQSPNYEVIWHTPASTVMFRNNFFSILLVNDASVQERRPLRVYRTEGSLFSGAYEYTAKSPLNEWAILGTHCDGHYSTGCIGCDNTFNGWVDSVSIHTMADSTYWGTSYGMEEKATYTGDLWNEIIGENSCESFCWSCYGILNPDKISTETFSRSGESCDQGECYYLTKGVSVVSKIVSRELLGLFTAYDLKTPPEIETQINLQPILEYVGRGKW